MGNRLYMLFFLSYLFTSEWYFDDNNYLIPCEKDQQIIRKMQLMRRQGTSYQKISTDITKQTRKKFPVSWVWKILKREGSEHKILNRPHNKQLLEVA